ncbi:MAG: hypothetical protein LBI86_11505 [Treponema sp.]|jgi:hypothetical protein|nr:hypothetical protein [Treponema sp.]
MGKGVFVWVLLFAGFTAGCRTLEKTEAIQGTVRVYGSEPHTYAGIETEDGRIYAIYPPEKEAELRELQGQVLEFTVRVLPEPKGYGSLFLKDGTVTPVSWKTVEF